jgi:hypothetical protein
VTVTVPEDYDKLADSVDSALDGRKLSVSSTVSSASLLPSGASASSSTN